MSSRADRAQVLRHHHFDLAAGINRAHIKAEVAKVNSINAKLAVLVTNVVGSMWCAYVFCLLALLSLPAVLAQFAVFGGVFPSWLVNASVIALVAWVAQTFIQLVLLSVIMVGQSVQSAASDARAIQTFEDTEKLLDLLDVHTEGGIKHILDRIDALEDSVKRPKTTTKATAKTTKARTR